MKCGHTGNAFRVACGYVHKDGDTTNGVASLLRTRHHRPSNTTAHPCNELTPLHSMTSSARTKTEGGIPMPRACAVLPFTASSNLVGCSTGRSAGLAPLRILTTIVPVK